MKYKVLLTGKNRTTIDEFFAKMYNSFECQTTSRRFEDITSHIQYFNPDVFVYCIQNESSDDITKVASIKHRNSSKKIPFVIIGDPEDCSEFNKMAVNVSDLTLEKPITASIIESRIIKYLKDQAQLNALIQEEIKKSNELFESLGEFGDNPFGDSFPDFNPFATNNPTAVAAPKRKHILVIDDDSRMLKVIKLHLHEKYDVATAISGKVAFKFLENKTTDLILLDYEMPEENGIEVLEKLRANPATSDIPVIFLTGITDRKKIQDALVMKPQGYLLKPIDRKRLLTTIQSTIG
ncbi:MAG: response regulator [Lachnospira sp.]|nr:response regulator [Lachnospira sp.]